MPFIGHHPYDGLDVSPDKTPPVIQVTSDPVSRARVTVRRHAVDSDDEAMLVDLLGLTESESV